jgi:3-dehydrosphinganine reductase
LSSFTLISVALFTVITAMHLFSKSKWDPRGKHCYIPGGSAGLGLALAIELTKRGAHVSIVARNKEKLQKALEDIEKVRQNPDQVLKAYSFSLAESATAEAALQAASEALGGRCPDVVFLCAGTARPGFFAEQDETSLRRGMDDVYWVQALSALAATKRMIKERVQGKIVFVSSLLGYMSIVGYSSYAPAKHALRGLAETLRSELLLYSISVHIFFPGTIYSPGYIEENKIKPKLTLQIEEGDTGATPEQSARTLLRGIENRNFHIVSDTLGNIFRASTRGTTPNNNVFLDNLYAFIGWIALPIWRWGVDSKITRHREEHRSYLADNLAQLQQQ